MVTIRYFAAARAARGLDSEQVDWEGPLDLLLSKLETEPQQLTTGGLSLADIFPRCSFLLNGARVDNTVSLRSGDKLDVLPPFAGG